MPYTKKEWTRRIADRSDICTGLVHLTRSTDTLKVRDVLLKILKDKKLIGSSTDSGFICGNKRAVCFQDAPLYSISQNVYYEQLRRENDKNYKIRYLAFGLAFPKEYLYRKGARPVIYEKTEIAKKMLPPEEWWRIVRLDLSDDSNFVDWTHEREWRLPGDLSFKLNQVTLVCIENNHVKELANLYKKETGYELRDLLRGVVTLKDILY
jgi:hypothetical protein